ncbi:epoxide hydrolase 1 [Gonapodya prolifera JEL478]|uniref:Epoxide hydrolase 1 n=1 Tax=Gonapodya prolifera (strain JEL478) TaxID=1344416 RepID=A0A139AQA7_GONPJ|nr:epoxide hydrolase 1 [Gonapodya prolifera JEL478]|eukprot:KXS18930.1 epoxide hydrolase 1 [Gonapodya prolifera JEL478]
MKTLGYSAYVAQGGDWGSSVTKSLALLYPNNCRAIHLNMPSFSRPPKDATLPPLTQAEESRIEQYRINFQNAGTGYQRIQATKPQTLGFAVSDSPIGLMAWIGEKFHEWVDLRGGDGDFSPTMTIDHFLTNVMIYYITNSITSSFRLYHYQMHRMLDVQLLSTVKITVPVGCAVFPHEIFVPPKSWVAYWCPNLVQWSIFERGGHFAALERTEDLIRDIRNFAGTKTVQTALTSPAVKL